VLLTASDIGESTQKIEDIKLSSLLDTRIRRKTKKEFGNNGSKDYYQIPGSNIKRYTIEGKEVLKIKINNKLISGNKTKGNILVSLIDGMGIEFSEEYNLIDIYELILDQTNNTKLLFTKNTIKQVSFDSGEINLFFRTKNITSKNSKLKYYLEV
jgi:hypothetical protein